LVVRVWWEHAVVVLHAARVVEYVQEVLLVFVGRLEEEEKG